MAVRHICSFLSSISYADTCSRQLLDDTKWRFKDFYNTFMYINNRPINNSIISNIINNSVQYIVYPEAGASSYVPSQNTGSNYNLDFHEFFIFCKDTMKHF
jgi:hypothetical protein